MPWRELYWHRNFFFDKVSHLKRPSAHTIKIKLDVVTFFDQVARPSRLVLGKKFFWIWFIYALEGIVLALQFFF